MQELRKKNYMNVLSENKILKKEQIRTFVKREFLSAFYIMVLFNMGVER